MICLKSSLSPVPPTCKRVACSTGRVSVSSLARCLTRMTRLRRRYIALLVDYVEDFFEQARSVPLPALMRAQLREPWATGALMLDDDLIVQLDLRAVARSALLNHAGERP
jgi:hypothetical protein